MSASQPLSAKIEGDELVIRIGIGTLAWAAEFEGREPFWDFNEERNKFVQLWKITDDLGWAEDVCREINREEEDGSSPLTNLLDKASEEALDQGSLSVWSPELDPIDPEDEDA